MLIGTLRSVHVRCQIAAILLARGATAQRPPVNHCKVRQQLKRRRRRRARMMIAASAEQRDGRLRSGLLARPLSRRAEPPPPPPPQSCPTSGLPPRPLVGKKPPSRARAQMSFCSCRARSNAASVRRAGGRHKLAGPPLDSHRGRPTSQLGLAGAQQAFFQAWPSLWPSLDWLAGWLDGVREKRVVRARKNSLGMPGNLWKKSQRAGALKPPPLSKPLRPALEPPPPLPPFN